ncbi:MAG: leucine-rich repeat domain-containing protein [Ruminococcaceae bacterium]|nr:leucine-rich repeat domain-containing protein [Oscillospiraceae bacterium]
MFFKKGFSLNIKRFICAAVLMATVLSLCACIEVDLDSYFEGLLGGDAQQSTPAPRPEKDESADGENKPVEIPEAAAEDFTVTEHNGTNGNAGVAVVSYNGNETAVRVPEQINGAAVVAVYANAFSDREAEGDTSAFGVKQVVLPATVERIEYGAFNGCKKIEIIDLPFVGGTDGGNSFGYIFGEGGVPESLQSVRAGGKTVADGAFSYCETLVSIELTEAENIGNNAFKGCSALKSLILPETVTAMGISIYDGCDDLETLAVPCFPAEGGTWFAGMLFGGTSYVDNLAVMPQSLQNLTVYWQGDTVGKNAFYECDRLVNLTVKGNISSIEEYAFYRCRRLKSLSFKGGEGYVGASRVGTNSFAYCNALGAVALADDIVIIPDYCFYSCASLRGIKFGETENAMPESVSAVGKGAFAYCENLVNMALSSNITVLPDSVFEGCAYLSKLTVHESLTSIGNNAFSGCTNLNSVDFAEDGSLSTVGNSAFAYCVSLNSVSLPDSVENLGTYVFSHCWGLKNVKLPRGISAVPDGCFFGCTRLDKVFFNPDEVNTIGERAFSGCEYLESLTLSEKIDSIGKYAFDECENLVFTVKVESYAHTWLVNNGVGSNNLKFE